ncbi:hypothetical protein ABT160_24155 [Streptomyces sp. NPDC001941]|uniref:hypothetical protein n=1 Tax=Streptomyces sp. NPDC001941 TaxID=3154659 RepID=UPI00332FBDC3
MSEPEVVGELRPLRGSDGQVYFRGGDVAALLRSVAAAWSECAAGDAPLWAPADREPVLLDADTVRALASNLAGQADQIDVQSIALTTSGVGPETAPSPKPSELVAGDEAEKALAALLSDRGVQEARARVEGAERELGVELSARLQPFQDRYDQAVREGDASRLVGGCAGKHGRWGRICVLPDGHETSMDEPHWGRNREGQPIAWAGSAPDDW